jgi:hypothetical protein
MASPHQFHERPGAVPDTRSHLFRAIFPGTSFRALPGYAFCPLAVSLDSMVKMAS